MFLYSLSGADEVWQHFIITVHGGVDGPYFVVDSHNVKTVL